MMMEYVLNKTDETIKHIYFTIEASPKGKEDQLIYEANLNRAFKISWRSNDVYRIAKSKWDKLQSYVRGVNKLKRFRF